GERLGERVGEVAEAGAKHDANLRNLGHPGANRVSGLAHMFVVAHYRRKPAMVAVMKLASVPANIARSPRRARSWRRFGASAPIPPIWIPIELKLAKPQSAKVAIVNDFASSDAFSGPSCE